MNQQERAKQLRQLHELRPLVLPNAWDAASARLVELAGAKAIASTSAGVAWSLGYGDGEQLQRSEMIEAIQRMVRVVNVPVTADIESGYGRGSLEDVAETVRAVIAVGAAGINLEDSPGRIGESLLTAEQQAERIRMVRTTAQAVGGDLVINARTDVFLAQVGAPESRFDETVRRANLYHAAGADCLFIPGVVDAAMISKLVRATHGPISVMAGPGAPTIHELGQLGVARVSVGPAITLAALAATQKAARELLEQGTYESLTHRLPFADVNGMFADA